MKTPDTLSEYVDQLEQRLHDMKIAALKAEANLREERRHWDIARKTPCLNKAIDTLCTAIDIEAEKQRIANIGESK
jgi:hypothetical protein